MTLKHQRALTVIGVAFLVLSVWAHGQAVNSVISTVYTEGTKSAHYMRGTGHLLNGRARVELPRHFSLLASQKGLTVTVTPCTFASKGLGVQNKTVDGFEVGELQEGRGSYDFDWEVKAVRREYEGPRVYRVPSMSQNTKSGEH